MSVSAGILLDLFIIFAAAKLAGELFERVRQPPVIGELLAGILIGPYALGLIGHPDAALIAAMGGEKEASDALHTTYAVISELGAVVLLYFVGLETRASELLRHGGRALAVACLGVLLPFMVGLGYMALQPTSLVNDLFVAAAMVATSVGITARVLSDLGALRGREGRIILGAAVFDDILGIMTLAIVVGLASAGGAASLWSVPIVAAQAVGFTLFLMIGGSRLSRRYSVHLERLHLRNAPFVVSIGVTLGLAALAGVIGLAAIIGAFLAGMVFAEAREQYELERQALPVYDFLVPFFFVITGSLVDWHVFLDMQVLGLAVAISLLAIGSKLLGGGLGSLGLPRRSVAIVAVGMVPRGEVGLIIAGIGQTHGALEAGVFPVLVIMSVVTTVLVPPILNGLLGPSSPPPPPPPEVPLL
ncbi:MAG: cation:proton antiporter [Chloroflexi bacterium]|nr:cation:proton antiporter [Chloroflexota bacterium]